MTAPSRIPSDSKRTAAIQQLESLERSGVRVIGRAGRSGSRGQPKAAGPTPKAVEALAPPVPRAAAVPSVNAPSAPQQDTLQIIQAEVAACQRCGELASTRTQTVFGVGNPKARLCFLGEAPGADEDRQGEPFVGRAGQLLTKIIEACTLARSDVYILNVLKCRPPGNRTPLPDEVSNCRGFLDRQLAIIRPDFICCLGSVAAQTLLETDQPIGRMRGKLFSYRGIPVVCTYHPAYLLRNPAAKKDVWDDMKMLLAKMGIELPKKSEAAGT
ncbi:MAG TPA: uracil-DNA glycosylase [Pirellulales bacterium]|jgi:DNA polymerase